MEDEAREGLNRAEQLAARARDLAARAEQISQQAADAGQSEEQLAQLERELAQLDEEERSLDAEFDTVFGDDREHPQADDAPRGRAEDRLSGWADRLTERMESFGDRFSEAMSAAFSARPFGKHDTVERDLAVDAALPVSVHNFAGKIEVKAGGSDRVHVTALRHGWTEGDRDAITVDIDRDDGGVHIRARSAFPQGHRWANLTVTVPATSPLLLATQGGSIWVDDVGGPVVGETRGGSVHVNGAVGDSSLETMGGSVTVTGHQGPVTARTKGGSVKVEGTLTGTVDASTLGGSIRIDGVDGTVRAETMGGSVQVSGRLRGVCCLTTAGGSVSARLASGSNVVVDATGHSASTDVPGLTATRGRIEGTVGTGADGTVTLRTSGGSVRVHTD